RDPDVVRAPSPPHRAALRPDLLPGRPAGLLGGLLTRGGVETPGRAGGGSGVPGGPLRPGPARRVRRDALRGDDDHLRLAPGPQGIRGSAPWSRRPGLLSTPRILEAPILDPGPDVLHGRRGPAQCGGEEPEVVAGAFLPDPHGHRVPLLRGLGVPGPLG